MKPSAGKKALKVAGVTVVASLATICAGAVLWVLANFVMLTFFDNALRGTWSIVVPNNYRGTLVIYVNCPGGHPFVRDGTIVTRFSSTGTDCVRDGFPTWTGQYDVHRADGTPIPYDPDGAPKTGDAFAVGGSEGASSGNQTGPELDFMDFYVGPAYCVTDLLNATPVPKLCHRQDRFDFATAHKAFTK